MALFANKKRLLYEAIKMNALATRKKFPSPKFHMITDSIAISKLQKIGVLNPNISYYNLSFYLTIVEN